jgi:hypothetical protein
MGAVDRIKNEELGVVMHACKPTTWEFKAGRS